MEHDEEKCWSWARNWHRHGGHLVEGDHTLYLLIRMLTVPYVAHFSREEKLDETICGKTENDARNYKKSLRGGTALLTLGNPSKKISKASTVSAKNFHHVPRVFTRKLE